MRIKIEFEVDLPDIPHTESEIEEFLRYSFGATASMRLGNPFNDYTPETVFETFTWDKI